MSDARHPVEYSPSDSGLAEAQFQSEPPQPAVSKLERPIAAIRRYKWLVLGVFAVAVVGGVIGTNFIVPQYQAKATLWIQTEDPRQGSSRSGPIRSAELLNTSAAWIELFRSYRVVDAVVRDLTLYLHTPPDARQLFAGFALAERFRPGEFELRIDSKQKSWAIYSSGGAELERGGQADSVGRKLGFTWMLPAAAFTANREVPFTVATPRETSMQLLANLEPRMVFGSNFLWLTYSGPDGPLAERTLNTWLNEFVRVASDLKKKNMVEFATILEDQLRFAEEATQNAERAYQKFRVNTITLPTEGGPVAAGVTAGVARDPALESYFDQKIELDNLRHDREALERMIASANTGTAQYEGLLLIPSVAQSPGAEALRNAFRSLYEEQAKLRAERQSFTDEFPAIKQRAAAVAALQTKTIPDLAEQLLGQLRERERDYDRRIAGASRELQQIPPRTIEEMRLHRAVVVAEGLYTNLKARFAEAKLAEASATPDVSVLDPAVAPLNPTKNQRTIIILVAVAGGLGAGLGLALLLDMIDKRFRYASQAPSELGLQIAGTVPKIPKQGINTGSPEQVVQFVESFRTLRMHVLHSLPRNRMRVAVTSAGPGEGKSLVSVNLALSFADAGLRTILIDGDTRRGALHTVFGQDATVGLTEYLSGSSAVEGILRPTTHANLWFISCGRRNARSPELIASNRLRDLIDQLSAEYDVVLLDTPPLAAGIDGFAISAAAGSALMVVRLGQTERRMAAAKLAVLDRLPVAQLGAVLNGVEASGEFSYYSYTPGYAVTAADSPEAIGAGSSSQH